MPGPHFLQFEVQLLWHAPAPRLISCCSGKEPARIGAQCVRFSTNFFTCSSTKLVCLLPGIARLQFVPPSIVSLAPVGFPLIYVWVFLCFDGTLFGAAKRTKGTSPMLRVRPTFDRAPQKIHFAHLKLGFFHQNKGKPPFTYKAMFRCIM